MKVDYDIGFALIQNMKPYYLSLDDPTLLVTCVSDVLA